MKILIIASLYKPYARGGAEVVVQTVVDELKKNHDVQIVTLKPWHGLSSLFAEKKSEDGLIIHRFYPLNIFSFITISRWPAIFRLAWHVIDTFNIHSYFVVRQILKKEKPDCILTHNLKGMGYLIPVAIKKNRIHWIHTMHDVQLRVPSGLLIVGNESLKTLWANKVYTIVCRHLFGSPSGVIFPSVFLKNFYEEKNFFPRSKKILLANPLPDQFFSSKVSEQRADDVVSFLFVGQLEKHKGIQLLVKSFLQFTDLRARLEIVGAGSLEGELMIMSAHDSRITFLGYQKHSNVHSLSLKTHFSVMPTLCYENSPLTIYESLSCGAPVIVADIGGCAELVENGVHGIVIEPNNEQALQSAFTEAMLIVSDGRYGDMSKNARESMSEHSTAAYVKEVESLL